MPRTPQPKMTPLPHTRVHIEDAFWQPRLETNRVATLPIQYARCKETGRLDAFELVGRQHEKTPDPHYFWDSDVAKWIEAAAYSLATHPDKTLETRVDRVVETIAAAQLKNGYLNVYHTVVEPTTRWANLRDRHELYCAGHLMEAAVAYYEATGKRKLLDVLCRFADHIAATFGRGKGKKRGYPGHEEIELALVKLHRATGEKRYLELARYFVDERGRQPNYFEQEARKRGDALRFSPYHPLEYYQAHKPVREQTEAVGHAVRAGYLYAGMADVAALTGDKSLRSACKRLWRNLTRKRMHITGGIGPTHLNEGFTVDYDLPNESAYLETCAAIALVFWAQRMLALEPSGEYADVMERALYNGVLSGVGREGETFFYGNPLATYPGFDGNGRFAGEGYHYRRARWFDCACCPPNIARLLASLGGYFYGTGRREIFVHLYAAGTAEVELDKQTVRLEQKTRYPWKETVTLKVAPERPADFALALRLPGWCRGAKLAVNGKAVRIDPFLRKGYVRIAREWRKGDTVKLTLPMPVERVRCHPRARQNAGQVAMMRGPLVYCLEEADNGADLHALALPPKSKVSARFAKTLLGGCTVLTGKAVKLQSGDWKDALYRTAPATSKRVAFKAIPYCYWANRKPGEMRVWLREA